MNSKLLIIVIGLVIVVGGFFVLGSKKQEKMQSTGITQPAAIKSQESPTPAQMKPETAQTITLTSTGFSPKEITVKAGVIVIWMNKSGKAATVNSDNHPTHQLYPFLNLGEFPNSSSLQVVFAKAGKYSYHDHYNASHTGTVTVE